MNNTKLKKKRALLISGGGFCSAFSAGFLKEISKKIKPSYFTDIYSYSSGVYVAACYTTSQLQILENINQENLNLSKIFENKKNVFKNKSLNLEILSDLLKFNKFNTQLFLKTGINHFLATDVKNLSVEMLKPNTPKEIFDFMQASSTLIGKPLKIKNSEYIDGAYAKGIPLDKIMKKNYDEIIILFNRPPEYLNKKRVLLFSIVGAINSLIFFRFKQATLCIKYQKNMKKTISEIKQNKKIKFIFPKKQILKEINDHDQERLSKTFNQGKKYALKWINKI